MAITLNGLENQTKVITMNALGEYDNLRPQVKPVEATHAQMVAMRDQGKLIPGQLYRITDYVTTTMQVNTRSAGHQFDIIVMALDATTISEEAWAIQHDGDEYFANSNLSAWKLRYTLDNVQWSQKVGTLIEDENDGFTALSIGTVDIDGETYILWDASEFEEDFGFTRLVSLTKEVGADMWAYDPSTGEKGEDAQTSIAAILGEYTEPGNGTITWMRDEFGNECPYDFKNVQTKRWKVTDSMDGRAGFTDTYLGVLNNTPENLSIEDEEDFIWAFTFSSDASGGEQTDFSLDGTHSVYGNIIKEMKDGSLSDNVFFGEDCYQNTLLQNCQYNSFSRDCFNNSFAQGCSSNSFSRSCSYNSFAQVCSSNGFSEGCQYNSFLLRCSRNSFSDNCGRNSFAQECSSNIFSKGCSYNSFAQGCGNNSFSEGCQHNSFSNNAHIISLGSYMQQVIVESGNMRLNVICNQSPTIAQPCKNIKIEQGVGNTSAPKTVTITTKNQNFQTVVKNANSVEITA